MVTDSYHGLIFSILFNKPFKIINNMHGGTSRINSLLATFQIDNTDNINWANVNKQIQRYKEASLFFLKDSLK